MKKKFVLVVHQPPYGQQGAYTALRFAEQVIDLSHHIEQIFFYQDGVYNASELLCPQSDELNLAKRWHKLHIDYNVPLICCSAAALRRGIISPDEQKDYQLPSSNTAPAFVFSGLGELVKAMNNCDKLVQF
jgi:tRNA 2-thiouridine synthesizing protein D